MRFFFFNIVYSELMIPTSMQSCAAMQAAAEDGMETAATLAFVGVFEPATDQFYWIFYLLF